MTVLAGLLLTVVVGSSLAWNLAQTARATEEMARTHARAAFDKDVLYRRWNARNMGVYAPASKTTSPNPYLELDRRDIQTPGALINPAYMTRQVHELGANDGGVLGHITSLKPIRPQNAADTWETVALKRFERGATEHSSLEVLAGVDYLRLMKPLLTERACLKCHAAQGYSLGDVRGGISVAIPMAPLRAIEQTSRHSLILWHGVLWLLGLAGIGIWRRTAGSRERERRMSQTALLEHAERFEKMFARHDAVMLLINPQTGKIVDANAAAARMYGYSRDELSALTIFDINQLSTEEVEAEMRNAMEQNVNCFVFPHRLASGEIRTVEVHSTAIAVGQETLLFSIVNDISDRVQAEADRTQLEQQLRQSQKMEAIGQLAGGVAHDFNNLLTAILCNCDLGGDGLPPQHPAAQSLAEIRGASERAVSLTSQLLAFSRKQLLQPRTINLNNIVGELDKLLGRLLSEDIELETVLDPELGLVHVDPRQLEQVILNLAVNARDAMPDGGVLTISTANVEATTADETSAGLRVMVAVADTGCGMSEEVRSKIFEPFFTTKGRSRGTGLGLSTAYGIVQQSAGDIQIESEVGRGTTLRVLLPRVTEAAPDSARAQAISQRSEPERGSNTILVCEDDERVLDVTATTLRKAGYTVLTAENGEAAIRLADEHTGMIDLLLTDVVMPGASGKAVADALTAQRPEIAVIFMSGYTDDVIGHHGVLEEDTCFIQKPFSPQELVGRVAGLLSKSEEARPRRGPS